MNCVGKWKIGKTEYSYPVSMKYHVINMIKHYKFVLVLVISTSIQNHCFECTLTQLFLFLSFYFIFMCDKNDEKGFCLQLQEEEVF